MKANNWLNGYRKKIYSQNGEEGVLNKIFEVIETAGPMRADSHERWCLEFGAGRDNDNTRHLIENQRWHGVLIESDMDCFAELAKRYRENKRVTCIQRLVHFEGMDSLDAILQSTSIPAGFDLLVVDIDGNDIHVWDSLSSYEPKAVMIEYNGRIPLGIEFAQPKDANLYWGSSLDSIVKVGKRKGYELVYAHAWNAIFVRKDLFSLFEIVDNSPAELIESFWPETRWFQLHDGTIILHGTKRKKMLNEKKRVSREPLYLLVEGGNLFPVRLKRDAKLLRPFKKWIKKNAFFYKVFYPVFTRSNGRKWDRNKRLLQEK